MNGQDWTESQHSSERRNMNAAECAKRLFWFCQLLSSAPKIIKIEEIGRGIYEHHEITPRHKQALLSITEQ